jgi:hypothetical protein
MPTLNRNAILGQRSDLLGKLEEFASEILSDLKRRGANPRNFWHFMDFCSLAVFNLISWEQIHVKDLERMPSVKKLIFSAAEAARSTISADGSRDSKLDAGGRRSFNEIGAVALAANILPRLENILIIWGITPDPNDGSMKERKFSADETAQFNRYFRTS